MLLLTSDRAVLGGKILGDITKAKLLLSIKLEALHSATLYNNCIKIYRKKCIKLELFGGLVSLILCVIRSGIHDPLLVYSGTSDPLEPDSFVNSLDKWKFQITEIPSSTIAEEHTCVNSQWQFGHRWTEFALRDNWNKTLGSFKDKNS